MKILLGVLAIAVALLAVDRLVLNQLPTATSQARPATRAPGNEPVTVTAKPLLPALSAFDEIWKRPLFNPAREAAASLAPVRNNNPASRQSNASDDQPPDFTIVGVAISPDGGAIMVQKSRRELVRVLLGEEIDGWRVDELAAQTVTLSKDGSSWQLPVGGEN